MIVASFLTKDIFIDWRLGASWFLDTLVDTTLYFRIFNPILQGEKVDPNGDYVKQWIPELKFVPVQWVHKPRVAPQDKLGLCLGREYSEPVVDHLEARNKALLHYKMIGTKQPYKKD